jgi:4'-phosphopantetheinyl transferase
VIELRKINGEISIGLLDLASFSQSKNIIVKREQEKSGTLFLLDHLVESGASKLRYTSENKPYLSDSSLHISISHSHNMLAIIATNAHSTGIDIELIRDKILRVRHKFLNHTEAEFAGSDLHRLTTIWGAKEAMYKAYGLKGVDFREHLEVKSFTGNELQGTLKKNGKTKEYHLAAENLGDYIMVYICNEI